MTEQDQNPNPTPPQQPPAEPMIPKHRFDEVNNQLKELRAWKEQQEAALKQQQDEDARKRGDFETLLNERNRQLSELQPQAERATALEAAMRKQLEARIEALPKELRKLVEGDDVLDSFQRLAHAEQAAAALMSAASAGTPPGPRGTRGSTSGALADADLIAQKRMSGIY